jgi:hypothetical protein
MSDDTSSFDETAPPSVGRDSWLYPRCVNPMPCTQHTYIGSRPLRLKKPARPLSVVDTRNAHGCHKHYSDYIFASHNNIIIVIIIIMEIRVIGIIIIIIQIRVKQETRAKYNENNK